MSGIAFLVFILKRHWLTALAAVTATFGAAGFYLYRTTPLYETSARLMLNEQRVSVSELGQAISEIEESRASNPLATQAELVKSQRVLQRALDKLVQRSEDVRYPLPPLEKVSSHLRVAVVPATNILELSYRDPNPERAAIILNAIAEAMAAEDAEAISQKASSVREFLEAKVPQQLAKLEDAELAEAIYRRQTGLIAAETQVNSLVEGLAALDEENRTLSAQLQEVTTRNALLQRITGTNALQQAYVATRLGQDEDLTQIRKRLLDLEAQVIAGRSRLGDQHPDLLALIQQRDDLRDLYRQQVVRITSGLNPQAAVDAASQKLLSEYIQGEVQRNALSQRLQVVVAQQANLQSRLTDLPARQLRLAALERQREEVASTLKLLQTKLEEARIAEAQSVSNIRIVGLAEPPEAPVAPKPLAVLVLATAAGAVLAVALIAVLESLDTTLRTAAEAEASLKLPVLGHLPKRPASLQGDSLEAFLSHPDAIAPYDRLLKTLDLQSKGQPRVMVFASTVPGEGSPSVALRLAAIAALLGRRTLLVDAASHLPDGALEERESALWCRGDRMATLPLLTIAPLPNLVQVSPPLPGFFLAHPAQFLEAPTLQPAMLHAREQYDLVVVSAPPLQHSADAMALSPYADALMLVVRPAFLPKALVQQAVAELQKNGVSIQGIVLNDATDRLTPPSQRALAPQLPHQNALAHPLRWLRSPSATRHRSSHPANIRF